MMRRNPRLIITISSISHFTMTRKRSLALLSSSKDITKFREEMLRLKGTVRSTFGYSRSDSGWVARFGSGLQRDVL